MAELSLQMTVARRRPCDPAAGFLANGFSFAIDRSRQAGVLSERSVLWGDAQLYAADAARGIWGVGYTQTLPGRRLLGRFTVSGHGKPWDLAHSSYSAGWGNSFGNTSTINLAGGSSFDHGSEYRIERAGLAAAR